MTRLDPAGRIRPASYSGTGALPRSTEGNESGRMTAADLVVVIIMVVAAFGLGWLLGAGTSSPRTEAKPAAGASLVGLMGQPMDEEVLVFDRVNELLTLGTLPDDQTEIDQRRRQAMTEVADQYGLTYEQVLEIYVKVQSWKLAQTVRVI